MSAQSEALRLAEDLELNHKFCPEEIHQQAADELRRLHAENEALKQDRRVLQATGDHPAPCARHCEANAFGIELRRLHAENEVLRADAERYRWLRDNSNQWSWNPSKYNEDVVSGFAAYRTGYLGYSFAAAIDAARGQK